MNVLSAPKLGIPIEGDLTHSSAGERYAQVVDRLLQREPSSHQILVTSPNAGDGKTVTAVNLAFAFHARRISVLLAELSFKRPSFSGIFTRSPLSKGIESVLTEGIPLESTVCVRNDNNLRMAMVNNCQPNDDLLAPNERLGKLLEDARTSNDWTIFDGPSTDAIHIRTLASSVGLVLLVVRAGRTRTDDLHRALDRIASRNTLVLFNDD
ncbi:tyrosine-protein kinase family protein [Granulicella arctica]|uniref:tyrosine-protein kinase family protein n=1 Tax=Granulicella arctica TaxID=940613 RepID=UPI0021E04441|nr:hypothetical protein [Granulicella arctica]